LAQATASPGSSCCVSHLFTTRELRKRRRLSMAPKKQQPKKQQPKRQQPKTKAAPVAPPTLGPEVRATHPEQLRRGLAALAALVPQPPPPAPAPTLAPPSRATPGPSGRAGAKMKLPATREARAARAGEGEPIGARTVREAPSNITKPDIRRLARKAGCQRVAMTIYEDARSALTEFLEMILTDATVFTEYAKRKTVAPSDIILSLRRHGKVVYGT